MTHQEKTCVSQKTLILLFLFRVTPGGTNSADSAWRRVTDKALNAGVVLPDEWVEVAKNAGTRVQGNRVYLSNRFTYHDIKAKGITDHAKENAGDHRTAKATAVYQRKPKIMQPTR